MAFRLLGSSRISSFTDGTPGAKLATDTYDEYLCSFLSIHPWKFATKQASLPAEAGTPIWGWNASYPVPNDALRVLYVNGEGIEDGRWQPREGGVVTNLGGPIEITYVAKSTAYGQWGGAAIDAFSAMLAMNWAMTITQSPDIVNQMEQRYEKNLRRARSANGSEGSPMVLQTTSWLESRIGDGSLPGRRLAEPS
jgi:hypothetical protein